MTDDSRHMLEDQSAEKSVLRCPECDSVIAAGAEVCLMCGARTPPIYLDQQAGVWEAAAVSVASDKTIPSAPADKTGPQPQSDELQAANEGDDQPVVDKPKDETDIVESYMVERQSRLTVWLSIGFFFLIGIAGVIVLRNPPESSLAFFPTPTPLPQTWTFTPTFVSQTIETSAPTATPTITPLPSPSETPRPPRLHSVTAGETLFGLGLRYSITTESIALANGLATNSSLQVAQELIIPWPTATPPLVAVEVDIGGETIVADPAECRMYEIKGGDTFLGIASRERIDWRALIKVNRLTEQSILQPGDLICIPKISRSGILPATPGPSPSPSVTHPPPGPYLLYPVEEAVVDPPEGPLFFQWAAVKDLEVDEWYMVEVTDLSAVDSHPERGFTRQTSFLAPDSWRPDEPAVHILRWRVQIVQETGKRSDGSLIFTFGGRSSEDSYFSWLGAVPTPTPSPTAEATLSVP